MKSKFILAIFVSLICLSSVFSSEAVNFNDSQSNALNFSMIGNQSFDLFGAQTNNTNTNAGSGYSAFVRAIAPYESAFLYAAIGDTIGFGSFFITGIVLMAIGNYNSLHYTNWADYLTALYISYAGYALLGTSWLFFIVAAVCWPFWGIIQDGRKKGYVLSPFISGDSIGLAIRL